MGLHTDANLVWVVADTVVYLWRHGSTVATNDGGTTMGGDAAGGGSNSSWGGVPSLPRGVGEDVCSFSVPSGQCVVGVGVVRPKRGEFLGHYVRCLFV
jgi:hypothetical protein